MKRRGTTLAFHDSLLTSMIQVTKEMGKDVLSLKCIMQQIIKTAGEKDYASFNIITNLDDEARKLSWCRASEALFRRQTPALLILGSPQLYITSTHGLAF